MTRAEELLKRYRVLEDALEARYPRAQRRHASVVMDFLSDPESEPFRERLDLVREIRNILSHNADSDGDYVVEPSQEQLDRLDEVISFVTRPVIARDMMTPAERMLFASPAASAMSLMREMEARGLSHVPVLRNGAFMGVFSQGTVFSYLLQKGVRPIDERSVVADFKALLPIERHVSERYDFVAENATLTQVRSAFQRKPERDRRLAALFVTRSGDASEPLLGIVTSWDALGKKV